MRSFARVLAAGCLLAGIAGAAAGCSGGDPAAEARRVRDRWVQESADHRRFDLEISHGATDPVRREQLVAAIADEQFAIASLALDLLATSPPDEARDALRRVFDSKGGVLKLRAAEALGRLGDEAAVAFLRDQLADPAQSLDPDVVAVLAEQGGERLAGPILAVRTTSDALSIREEAYAALGAVRRTWATDRLLEGLEREHGEERRVAIQALGRTGDPRVSAAIERFVNTKGLVFVTLEALGAVGNPAGRAAVRTMLSSAEPTVRAYAGVALWRLGAKSEAEPVVAALVRDPEPSARAVLADQLRTIDDAQARAHLATLAGDPVRPVRIAALRSIAEAPQPGEQALLLGAAADSDYQIQTIALAALARAGDRDAIEAIRPLLASENPYVALAASNAIVEISARTSPS